MFNAIERMVAKAPRIIIFAAVLVTVAAGAYGSGVFTRLSGDSNQTIAGSESAQVADIVRTRFAGSAGSGALVVFDSKTGLRATDPAYQREVQKLLAPLAADGAHITSYYSTGRNSLVSRDGKATIATVALPGSADTQFQKLTQFEDATQSNHLLTVSIGGDMVATKEVNQQVKKDLEQAELISLPLLAILLFIFFRSVVAALVPLGLGVVSIMCSFAILRGLTHLTNIDQYAINIITILGLGLSVDYSLLMVNRFREELANGKPVPEAVTRVSLTAGRTIFFSALTVIVCLLALHVFPVGFLHSISVGGAAAVAATMVLALLLVPAVLLTLGRRIDTWHLPIKRHTADSAGKLWHTIALTITRHPILALLVSISLVVISALPVRHMHFVSFDYHSLPTGSSSRQAAETVATRFDNQSSPIVVIYTQPDPLSAKGLNNIAGITDQIARQPAVGSVMSPMPTGLPLIRTHLERVAQMVPAGSAASPLAKQLAPFVHGNQVMITVYTRYDAADSRTQDLVKSLRDMPVSTGTLRVGGAPAILYDTLATVRHYLPYAALIIGVAMFILLALLLRSLVLPLQAILINTFALLIAFGVLVFVFQGGHGTGVSWLNQTGGMDVTLPLLIFAIAFGLSMDYAAFLYSRMREIFDESHDPTRAIVEGVQHTGPTITAAAVVLFIVVAAFASSKIALIQQVGVGLSVAVLADAFLVRLVLVPAVMRLFGRASWYAPGFMSRLKIKG